MPGPSHEGSSSFTSDDKCSGSSLRGGLPAPMLAASGGDPSPATKQNLPPVPRVNDHALTHAFPHPQATVIQLTTEDVDEAFTRMHKRRMATAEGVKGDQQQCPEEQISLGRDEKTSTSVEEDQKSAGKIDSKEMLEEVPRVDRDLRSTVTDGVDEQFAVEKDSEKDSDKAELEREMRVGQCDRCLALPIKTHRKCFKPSLETIEWATANRAWLSSTLKTDFEILQYVKCTDHEWDTWWTFNARDYYASKAVWDPEKIRRDMDATRKELFEHFAEMAKGQPGTNTSSSAFLDNSSILGDADVASILEGMPRDDKLLQDLLRCRNIARYRLRNSNDFHGPVESDMSQRPAASNIFQGPTASIDMFSLTRNSTMNSGAHSSHMNTFSDIISQGYNGSNIPPELPGYGNTVSRKSNITSPDQTHNHGNMRQGHSGYDHIFGMPHAGRRTQDLPLNSNSSQGLLSDSMAFQDFYGDGNAFLGPSSSSHSSPRQSSSISVAPEYPPRRYAALQRVGSGDSLRQANAAPSTSRDTTLVSSPKQGKMEWNIRCLR